MSDNYLPLFTSLRKDRRIKRLRKDHGNEGYGVFISVLQILREEPNFSYPLNDIDLLADDVECSEKLLKDIVMDYQLFSVNSIEMFFSLELNASMQPYLEKTEKMRALANKRWSKAKELGEGNAQNNSMRTHSDSIAHVERTESTGNANKVNKNKKDITHSSNTCYSFSEFWKEYDKKIDKARAEPLFNKLNEKDRQAIKDTLPSYIANHPDKKYRKYPATYLRGRCWEDELSDLKESNNGPEYKVRRYNQITD